MSVCAKSAANRSRALIYQLEKRFWPDQHYEGGNLFRDAAIIEMTPPKTEGAEWAVKFNWLSKSDGVATKKLRYTELQGNAAVQLDIPFDNPKRPGIRGRISLLVRPWNVTEGR